MKTWSPRMWAFSKVTKLTYKRVFDAHTLSESLGHWPRWGETLGRRMISRRERALKNVEGWPWQRKSANPQATLLITLIPIVKLNLSPKILWTRKWVGRDRVVFMAQSSFSRGIWTGQHFLLTYSNVPLDSSDAGVVLESLPDLEFQRARIHKVGDTKLMRRSGLASCLGWQEAADTQAKAFRDSVSLFLSHDPCWLHFVNHLIQMSPKYPCRVELGLSFSEDHLNPAITHCHFPIIFESFFCAVVPLLVDRGGGGKGRERGRGWGRREGMELKKRIREGRMRRRGRL